MKTELEINESFPSAIATFHPNEGYLFTECKMWNQIKLFLSALHHSGQMSGWIIYLFIKWQEYEI